MVIGWEISGISDDDLYHGELIYHLGLDLI